MCGPITSSSKNAINMNQVSPSTHFVAKALASEVRTVASGSGTAWAPSDPAAAGGGGLEDWTVKSLWAGDRAMDL